MRALLLPAVGRPLEPVERPVPAPGRGEVRVRVQACGVCGSDLFLQEGGFGADRLPRVPGHEAAGVVDEVGPDAGGWRAGDQVALYYIDSDPDGTWARAGRENLDPGLTRMGVDVDGAFAEYVVRPAHTLVRPAAAVDPAALAVLTDAVATPYHALVRIARLQAGETLLVLGIGGIGSNAVQIGRHLGARVVAASRGAAKLALAERLGADAVVA
ncbi:MAG: alcohol dehydrogenase catalytic domain-containing protein, partial [Solirubrobacteraceae bacterium]